MDENITQEPEFKKWILYYRIYRLMSAMLLNVGELHIGKKYGEGWKLFFDAEMNRTGNGRYDS